MRTNAAIIVERDVRIVMHDGCVLRADVWRPSATGKHPALLQRTPYNKSDSSVSVVFAGLEPLVAAERGWVVVIQDVRGRYSSDGDFSPFVHEGDDGVATMEWIAAQDWSDGDVFMYGQSYFGATQLLAAAQRPPALRAIAPNLTSSLVHDNWTHVGGAFQLGFTMTWAALSLSADFVAKHLSPASAGALATLTSDVVQHLDSNRSDLTSGVREVAPWIGVWREAADDDPYWDAVEVGVENVSVPALHIGGWFDLFLKGTLHDFQTLSNSSAEQVAAAQCLVIGPWAHGNLSDTVGDLAFGPLAAQAALGMTDLHLDWFSQVRAGRISRPRVLLFVMGENVWRAEDSWPPVRVIPTIYFLGRLDGHTGGTLDVADGLDGSPSSEIHVDTDNLVPTIGGSTFLPGVLVGANSGPRDRVELKSRDDIVFFDTPVLEERLELTGPVRAVIFVESDSESFDVCAGLADVDEHGVSRLLTDGIIRQTETPIRSVGRLEIDMVATSNVFLPGHRIRVEIAGSNFPRFDSAFRSSSIERTLTIHHGSEFPSHVVLPVCPERAEEQRMTGRG